MTPKKFKSALRALCIIMLTVIEVAASHDDLNDALVYLLQGLVNQGLDLPKIHWIET
jgi:hypothetical protein